MQHSMTKEEKDEVIGEIERALTAKWQTGDRPMPPEYLFKIICILNAMGVNATDYDLGDDYIDDGYMVGCTQSPIIMISPPTEGFPHWELRACDDEDHKDDEFSDDEPKISGTDEEATGIMHRNLFILVKSFNSGRNPVDELRLAALPPDESHCIATLMSLGTCLMRSQGEYNAFHEQAVQEMRDFSKFLEGYYQQH